ncbi:PepSY domain-containing protein [Roseisalinus antarcticus]|uniref:PepSY domain-containing protein n=1 Tax=Roseisalinus antarcticus TaxID=254357 RepID=A0A1Y5TG14_9RHOB|nr:PepSY domain-containing protein [Roseisalinus antarcticus]SLN63014.1 hypothetical protein ROA7023_02947 [Roseisalinus antarcticus]
MKTAFTILGFLAVFPAGVALADDDCPVPMADWQPREAVARLSAERNWTVRRIRIEVTLDPATLEVLDLEYEDDGHDEDHRHADGDDEGH